MFQVCLAKGRNVRFLSFHLFILPVIWENILSFPLIQGRVKKDHFNFVIKKIKRRLSNWKMKMPNKAGRTTLAKLVLMALPVYSMQSFWLPKTTCLIINKTNYLGDDQVVRVWDQEVCFLCGLRFEPYGCSYDRHWRLTRSLISRPVGLVEVRASWSRHPY